MPIIRKKAAHFAVKVGFEANTMLLMATRKNPSTVLEPERTKAAPPSLYKVLLLNDDFTPMEFVVIVLQRFFSMDSDRARAVMLQVHLEGAGICGIYPRDIAASKVDQVCSFARQHEHPLACVIEEE